MLNGDHYPDEGSRRAAIDRMLSRQRARERSWLRFAAAWISAVKSQDLARKRARDEKRKKAERAAAWEQFIRTEHRELQLRRDGQLAELLGAPLPGESPAALQRIAADDQRQAEAGQVALMSNGKTAYKDIEDLQPEDMPARIAANRLRTTWLKERRDGWLGRWQLPL